MKKEVVNVEEKDLPENIKKIKEEIESSEIDKELNKVEKKEDIKEKIETSEKTEDTKEKTIEEMLKTEDETEDEGESNVITLSKPIGNIKEIVLDLESLTGSSLTNIEKTWRKECRKKDNTSLIKELDGTYLAMVAAVASKTSYSLIQKLSAKDFTKVTMKVSSFLLAD
ncbi:hypothetical protein [Fusobacterium ulcerans]|uniref:hypothetical protein n=1 Tax=Fusobacterium ulcerans TaxID=861 RepID=UPI0027BAAAB7|nr:hypothetical protein [Fusobacterium ulcerans]